MDLYMDNSLIFLIPHIVKIFLIKKTNNNITPITEKTVTNLGNSL